MKLFIPLAPLDLEVDSYSIHIAVNILDYCIFLWLPPGAYCVRCEDCLLTTSICKVNTMRDLLCDGRRLTNASCKGEYQPMPLIITSLPHNPYDPYNPCKGDNADDIFY